MASKWAVCIAAFVHILLGVSVFITQMADSCSPAPHIASYIFATAVILVAANITLFPERYTHMPYSIQFVVETIGSLAILEFFDLFVWCRLERFIYHAVKQVCLSWGMDAKTYLDLEYWLLIIPTTAVAASVLFIATRVTKLKSFLSRQRINVNVNTEVYMDMLADNIERNNNQNRPCLRPRRNR